MRVQGTTVQESVSAEQIRRACQDFEALFIQELLKFMPAPPGSPVAYQDLGYWELARSLASAETLGIGRMLYEWMNRHG